MQKKINVTIWNEFRHEKTNASVKKLYPEGLHKAIAGGIRADDLNIHGSLSVRGLSTLFNLIYAF